MRVSERRVAKFKALPKASQATLVELYEIVANGKKDLDEREEDCRRVQLMLASGAPGVLPDACFDFGQSLLCLALHYDFGHPPQMLKVVLEAVDASERLTLKAVVNAPTNEVDCEHILEVCAALSAIDADDYMATKEEMLLRAGADVHWQESTTETDRSRASGTSNRSGSSAFSGRSYE